MRIILHEAKNNANWKERLFYGIPALNDADEKEDDGDNKKDMDKSVNRISGDDAQKPQNDEYDTYGD